MYSSFHQVNYGSTHAGDQSIMFNKTPLDIALEKVERKYHSIVDAPQKAVDEVQDAARGMGLEVKREMPNANTVHYKPIYVPRNHVDPVPTDFKVWTGKDKRKYTNYKPLTVAIEYTRQGYSPKDSCKLADFSYHRFDKLHLLRKGYIWNYKNIHQRVHSIKALIHYCKSLNWTFGPCDYNQWTFNKYKGTIKPFHYFELVHYRKDK